MVTVAVEIQDNEIAAIAALTGETPEAFVQRHVQHQLNFVVQTTAPSLEAKRAALSAEDRATVDAILAKAEVPLAAPARSIADISAN